MNLNVCISSKLDAIVNEAGVFANPLLPVAGTM